MKKYGYLDKVVELLQENNTESIVYDKILPNPIKSHVMEAASITSNVKSDKKLVIVKTPEGEIETGLKKFGAMLGDEVEVGCGSVLNPGTVVGSHTNIYPLSSVRGFVPAKSIYKKQGEVVEKQ